MNIHKIIDRIERRILRAHYYIANTLFFWWHMRHTLREALEKAGKTLP